MPRPAPVTSATLPERFNESMSHLFWRLPDCTVLTDYNEWQTT
jgi:hypothetical protein